MAQIQILHLCIDDRILSMPISILPVQIWQCEDWIFGALVRCSNHAGTVHALYNRSIYNLCTFGGTATSFRVVRTRTLVVHKGSTNFFDKASTQCVRVFRSIVVPQVAERSLEKFPVFLVYQHPTMGEFSATQVHLSRRSTEW